MGQANLRPIEVYIFHLSDPIQLNWRLAVPHGYALSGLNIAVPIKWGNCSFAKCFDALSLKLGTRNTW